MIQDFTFFFLPTLQHHMSTEKNKNTKKCNQEVRMEYKPSVNPMFSFTLRHLSNVSAHKRENMMKHAQQNELKRHE